MLRLNYCFISNLFLELILVSVLEFQKRVGRHEIFQVFQTLVAVLRVCQRLGDGLEKVSKFPSMEEKGIVSSQHPQ